MSRSIFPERVQGFSRLQEGWRNDTGTHGTISSVPLDLSKITHLEMKAVDLEDIPESSLGIEDMS